MASLTRMLRDSLGDLTKQEFEEYSNNGLFDDVEKKIIEYRFIYSMTTKTIMLRLNLTHEEFIRKQWSIINKMQGVRKAI